MSEAEYGDGIVAVKDSLLPHHLLSSRSDLERVSRAGVKTEDAGNHRRATRILDRYTLFTDVRDNRLGKHIAEDGFWEAWVTLAMARAIKPGFRCVDVGANVGYFTMLMADAAGQHGSAVAVEPNPRAASLIRDSLQANGFENRVAVLEKAAFNKDDVDLSLGVPLDAPSDASHHREFRSEDPLVTVGTTTIDTLTSDWTDVNLIKIDAEGAEGEIWEGMQKTILRPDLTIMMEVSAGRDYDMGKMLHQIRAAGFPIRHVDTTGKPVAVSDEAILGTNEDWMLFLQRS